MPNRSAPDESKAEPIVRWDALPEWRRWQKRLRDCASRDVLGSVLVSDGVSGKFNVALKWLVCQGRADLADETMRSCQNEVNAVIEELRADKFQQFGAFIVRIRAALQDVRVIQTCRRMIAAEDDLTNTFGITALAGLGTPEAVSILYGIAADPAKSQITRVSAAVGAARNGVRLHNEWLFRQLPSMPHQKLAIAFGTLLGGDQSGCEMLLELLTTDTLSPEEISEMKSECERNLFVIGEDWQASAIDLVQRLRERFRTTAER